MKVNVKVKIEYYEYRLVEIDENLLVEGKNEDNTEQPDIEINEESVDLILDKINDLDFKYHTEIKMTNYDTNETLYCVD